MPRSPEPQPWWDREFDHYGRRIRSDVRRAAEKVWSICLALAKRELSDFEFEAQNILERVVADLSASLDREHSPAQVDPSALLIYRFRLALYRRARALRRIEPAGTITDLEKLSTESAVPPEIERRIFIEQLIQLLEERNQGILRLRAEGYSWKEIGKMLNMKPTLLRRNFWRDVRRAYSMLGKAVEKPPHRGNS